MILKCIRLLRYLFSNYNFQEYKMIKLASLALMSCFVTGAIANDTKVIGEAYKEFGDVVFAPVKVSNYADQDNEMTFLAVLTKPQNSFIDL